jgi:hypothetical protein
MNFDMKVTVHKAQKSSPKQFVDELRTFADDFVAQGSHWIFEYNEELAFLYFSIAAQGVNFPHLEHIESLHIECGQYVKQCNCVNPQCSDA